MNRFQIIGLLWVESIEAIKDGYAKNYLIVPPSVLNTKVARGLY